MRRRCALVLGVLLVAGVGAASAAASAQAHPMPTSTVVLDIGPSIVTGRIELPLDRLAVARRRAISAAQAAGPQRAALEAYAREHVSVAGADGARWAVRIGNGRVRQVSGAPVFVLDLAVTPPAGRSVTDFRLTYDVILDQLVTHRVLVSVRSDFARGAVSTGGGGRLVGVLDWNHTTLAVSASGGSTLRGLDAMTRLGFQHVATGADHLLFVLMLLLPAPLVARNRRWQPGGTARRSSTRVLHTVTAFAAGHSTTLALATLGVLRVSGRPVETLIAASITVSAAHAIRPLVRRGEVVIAAGFGLVHGLAFASALSALALTRGSLVSSLFAFNVGIEASQLLLVALILPSLLLLARTRCYPAVRTALAVTGLVLSAAWLLDRAGLSSSDPFAAFTRWCVDHPFVIVGALALAAVAARTAAPSVPPPAPTPTGRTLVDVAPRGTP